ncbi:sigma-B regulation protein RsbQ [Sphingomonas sp. YR710]|jgi:sigma-B regulation protein RsbQ|uniref:alpha/beta fold hydrolase n=1 Tax=Sphingomonas sp. YR710 TaxID=1882773 RepID=UPI0008922A40|nr:alpha/beta hydrolase [Sphingomonas sp. YR710]SDB99670.1 sigma-B regulation protein RsbQ [Sphingomonas sp. YR710]
MRFEQLHGRISGQGERIVILSHGFGTDQNAWAALRPWLNVHFRVISYDLAGAGPDGAVSYDFERHGTLFGYADDLLDIMNELAIETCIYIGHSVSGMIGAAAASIRPEPFHKLVMIGASPRYLNDDHYTGGFDQPDLDGLFESMAANFQAWAAGFAPVVVGVPDNAAIDEFSRTLFQMRPDIALNMSRTIFQSDMRGVARQIERPTHIIQTSHDMAVPTDVAKWLNGAIDGSTLDLIDAAGHLPHMTAPAEILGVLEGRLLPGNNS